MSKTYPMLALAVAMTVPVAVAAQTPDGQVVRTFVVERHVITKDDYDRAVQGRDVRLAFSASKPKPYSRYEMRGQGDVFTGWTIGDEIPYRSASGLGYEFVGTIGEIQPGPDRETRTIMIQDIRLVRFFSYRNASGEKAQVPLVRKSQVNIDFPIDGGERAQVYAIPRGKRKFDYRLVTVREDVAKRRTIRMLDRSGRP